MTLATATPVAIRSAKSALQADLKIRFGVCNCKNCTIFAAAELDDIFTAYAVPSVDFDGTVLGYTIFDGVGDEQEFVKFHPVYGTTDVRRVLRTVSAAYAERYGVLAEYL
jgi:hypothetical protein